MNKARVTSRNVPVSNLPELNAMAPAARQGMIDALNKRYLIYRMAFICAAGWELMEISDKENLPQ
jgi:hypothetical protein